MADSEEMLYYINTHKYSHLQLTLQGTQTFAIDGVSNFFTSFRFNPFHYDGLSHTSCIDAMIMD